ncbi:glycoside hydrolase family 18 protein [Schizothecium vesticola]|uniref:Glycoside hydrolase family 18 protein n=1 Tax=Schizothecium vesticola TaxID=314040 RepID=A0AA40F2A4_9PEZI|nr:glycoside hydrolase family 18 protein [Schizothecium vesticola]
MRSHLLWALALFASLGAALPSPPVNPQRWSEIPRLVLYYQTTHDSLGRPISMLPLITEKHIALTHLIVCSFHINRNANLTLNDYPPSYPLFTVLWVETQLLRAAGVKVMGMIGGAAPGSFDTYTLDGPDAVFEPYYLQLRDAIALYGLQGMDLDVEQYMSLAGIMRLIRRLRADFGPGFIITLAPVASALWGGGSLSGFSYPELEATLGGEIAFYNAQFYNGFGWLGSTIYYDAAVSYGWHPSRLVAGQLTTPENGNGWVTHETLNATVAALRDKYGQIGGVMGWEYFNGKPGGNEQPWQWAQVMTAILRPGQLPRLRVTRSAAEGLIRAWHESVAPAVVAGAGGPGPDVVMNVDYLGMINP